jgi:hypothetical protein
MICVRDKKTRQIVHITEKEYEANKDKYVDIDDDPGFTTFCWIILGIIVILGIILFL